MQTLEQQHQHNAHTRIAARAAIHAYTPPTHRVAPAGRSVYAKKNARRNFFHIPLGQAVAAQFVGAASLVENEDAHVPIALSFRVFKCQFHWLFSDFPGLFRVTQHL